MYIVGFNGPPYSGKDTLARMLAEHMDSRKVVVSVVEVSLSTPLRRIAYQMIGQNYLPNHIGCLDYGKFKETHYPQFGCSGRQLMIDVSEKYLKLCYGQSIMANLLLADFRDFHGVLLVRDSGFQCEVDPLVDAVGADNLYIARVTRPGSTFVGDSREWVYHKHEGRISNGGSLDLLRTKAAKLYEHLVNQMGWKL